MFYTLKRVDEKQCNVGDVCMVLCDMRREDRLCAGRLGMVTEIYDGGIKVTWAGYERQSESWDLETIARMIREKKEFDKGFGWGTDDFPREDLDLLVFRTEKRITS